MTHSADTEIVTPQERSRVQLTPWLIALAILGSSLALAYRFFALINSYAVNLLFFDQWDFYRPLFREQGLWGMFIYQHGPHRQGLGGVVIALVAGLTGWNSRADAFAVGAIIAGAMLVALYLKRHLFRTLTFADVIIPLIFLNTLQYESLVITPNPAHGAVPLLLVVCSALAWELRPALARYTALVVLNFLLIFTGFGIFMGLITPALLALDIFQQARSGRKNAWLPPLIALALALMSIYAFSIGYVFEPAIACFHFPYQRPWEYPWFIGLMLARFIGLGYAALPLPAAIIGCALFALMGSVGIYHTMILVRSGLQRNPTSLAIALLIGFSLIFCANTAVGRICAGIEGSQASRYMTLLIPAFFGLYLHLLSLHSTPIRYVALALCIALLLPLPLQSNDAKVIQGFTEGKQRWKECHLRTGRIDHCVRVSGLAIYPAPQEIKERLAYLKEHHLNLFADQ